MTPKVKAKQLVDQYEHSTYSQVQGELAKQCASIAVDEIIDSFSAFDFSLKYIMNRDYWLDVKQEIEKL